MQKAYKDGQDALKKGDLGGYQKAMNEMKAALDRVVKLNAAKSSASAPAAPSGTAAAPSGAAASD